MFREALQAHFDDFAKAIATDDGEWTVKGFIDVYRNIYTISVDTKVVSKIIEWMLFPIIARFAAEHGLGMALSEHQNHYPDISFVSETGQKMALDLKSAYRVNPDHVSGFTLGAFTGYFRQRASTKNVTYPYGAYEKHYILGVIYSRTEAQSDERRIRTLDELHDIISVARDFTFVVHEKWRIAADRPGSGNTKNIGSVTNIEDLVGGKGPFTPYGEAVFDDYWMNYLTADMAMAIDSEIPYRNIAEYWRWRNRA